MKVTDFETFDELKQACYERYINIKTFDWCDLAVLTYSQIKSDYKDPLVQECRGLVIDKTTMEVVCRPFKKFENYNPHLDSKLIVDAIKAGKLTIKKKLDGSFIKVFYYKDKWRVGTKSEINALNLNNDSGFSYISMILLATGYKTIKQFEEWCEKNLDKASTHLFELISPYNKIVVDYKESKLVYLTSIKNLTGKHYSIIEFANKITSSISVESNGMLSFDNVFFNKGIPLTEVETVFNFRHLRDKTDEGILAEYNEIVEATRVSSDLSLEGYVVYIDDIPTFKLKTRLYVIQGLLKFREIPSDLLTRYLSEVICISEYNEFVSVFPEYKDKLDSLYRKYKNNLRNLVSRVADTIRQHRNDNQEERMLNIRKHLGQTLKDCPISGIIFKHVTSNIGDYIYADTLVYTLDSDLSMVIANIPDKKKEEFLKWVPDCVK